MFKYLITVSPLGFMYGSAGAFLSPENLVGRSGAKFPPDAATLAGLFFSDNKVNKRFEQEELRYNLYVAGPFWAKRDKPELFYVPIPRHRVISKKPTEESKQGVDEWRIEEEQWTRNDRNLESDYYWQRIDSWGYKTYVIRKNEGSVAEPPWKYVSILHPSMEDNERHVLKEDGLFLENAVQMSDDTCLVYLSTHELTDSQKLSDDWYRFGGENHLVEINSIFLRDNHPIVKLLSQNIQRTCALITPGVWGSNHLSYRYPKHPDFPKHKRPKMLTDRPVPYRYRIGYGKQEDEQRNAGRLGRGRYAVPPGSVYVFNKPLDKTWWEFPEAWFPKEGFYLKQVGCNLCLPVKIQGID